MDHRPQEAGSGGVLPVVFALHDRDGAYWLNTAVAVTSVLRYAGRPVEIHILHDDTLSDAARTRLGQIAALFGAEIAFVPTSVPAEIDPEQYGQFTPASAYRLNIPVLFAERDVVVYLDSDVVANGLDIHELVAAAPPEAALAAVHDRFIGRTEVHAEELAKLGLDQTRYFNSGVLVMRPKRLPKTLMTEFAAFCRSVPRTLHRDQDFLNTRFADEVELLDERFNTAVCQFGGRMVQPLRYYSGRLLHYAGRIKPLDGALSAGLIPFLAHAMLVPEITQGAAYAPKSYLFPVQNEPDHLRGKPLDRDPSLAQVTPPRAG